ncbi:MAG TPA: hypothetical protein VGN17_31425 [Bryobacteraceae bacterium]
MRRLLLLAICLPLGAQWLKYPTPGIPRSAEGKPNLTAPAPKTAEGKPDLSGIWHIDGLGYSTNITSDLKPGDMLPWAEAVTKERVAKLGLDNPVSRCLPPGPSIGLFGELQKVIQTRDEVAILNESGIFRQVFTDGRPLPEDPSPAWQGYSVGHWEGDTLVVETAGFNDRSWLDFGGHPHTEALRVTERYRRKDFGHMRLEVTFDDPKTFTRAWSIGMDVFLVPDTELLETVCNENEKDAVHLVGKLSDEVKGEIAVPRETAAKYVGTYEIKQPRMNVGISEASNGKLMMDVNGKGAVELIATSQTTFLNEAMGAHVDFFPDAQGKTGYLILKIVEGDLRGERK